MITLFLLALLTLIVTLYARDRALRLAPHGVGASLQPGLETERA